MRTQLCFIFILITLIILLKGETWAADIYVSKSGSDNNPGTKAKPLATVAIALRKARELRRLSDVSIKNGIHIIVENGTYYFSESLFIRPEDSGTSNSPTVIEAAVDAQVNFSGGFPITGWHKSIENITGLPEVAKGNVWETDSPFIPDDLTDFRQLWINDHKAVRAKDRNGDSMNRILSWDHKNQSCWIPKPAADISTVESAEMFIHQWWEIAILRIKSVEVQGDSARLSFHQPESRIQSEHPWPAPFISAKNGNSAYYLSNAIQFLDEPGEWYFDKISRRLYYWPLQEEQLEQSEVLAPVLETIVKVIGTPDHPVSFIYFKGISFEHAGWLRPSLQGHVPHQAGMYMLDAYKLKTPGTPEKKGLENQAWVGRPAAAVQVSDANHIEFHECTFTHLASTGLDFKKGVAECIVNGNLFKDIGGTGLLVGVFSDEAIETHLPYHPKDPRELSINIHITNNLITDVANEDWGCVGIGAGYVTGIRIEHNVVSNVSYTGISVGWGWTKSANAMKNNMIRYNKIDHYARNMYDVAGIYTLSSQPGTIISDNYIDSIYKAPYAHDPNHWFYLYTDEGSSYITLRDNWCPSEKFLKNANGPGNVWINNGPGVSISVKMNAGLQQPYQYLLPLLSVNNHWPVNW